MADQIRTIQQAVIDNLPPDFVVDPIKLESSIKFWQLYLQPLVDPDGIPDADVHDETKWPPLVNELIAKLIAYEYLQQAFMAAIAGGLTGSTTTEGSGGVKRVETGPSVAEWYDTTKSTVDLMRSIVTNPDGFFEAVRTIICMLAKRVHIYLPTICGQSNRVIPFVVGKGRPGCGKPKKYCGTPIPYPFNISKG